jgi:hypothetical protein
MVIEQWQLFSYLVYKIGPRLRNEVDLLNSFFSPKNKKSKKRIYLAPLRTTIFRMAVCPSCPIRLPVCSAHFQTVLSIREY